MYWDVQDGAQSFWTRNHRRTFVHTSVVVLGKFTSTFKGARPHFGRNTKRVWETKRQRARENSRMIGWYKRISSNSMQKPDGNSKLCILVYTSRKKTISIITSYYQPTTPACDPNSVRIKKEKQSLKIFVEIIQLHVLQHRLLGQCIGTSM